MRISFAVFENNLIVFHYPGASWRSPGPSWIPMGYPGLPWEKKPLKASKGVTTAALVSPNDSQQNIWASQGRAAEGGITMVVRVVLVGIP